MTTQPSDWAVELLPCPWCGRVAKIKGNTDWWTLIVRHKQSCILRDAQSIFVPRTDEQRALLIKDWNTRAPVARELDASGGGLDPVVTGWTKADGATLWLEQDGVPMFRFGKHADMGTNRAVHLYATPRAAEAGGDTFDLADLHDSLRTVYEQVPSLPITTETMDAATDALHEFCLLIGIHKVEIDAAMGAVGAGGGDG